MTDLPTRCETADGPDRELDLAICIALNTGRSTDPRNPGAPRYTASIDAALSLMPSEAFWRLGHDGEGGDPSLFLATVFTPEIDRASRPFDAVASTPALALLAAILKGLPHE